MHNIQAVLFDFDDTLQDREAAYRAALASCKLGREGFGIVQSLSWPEGADAQGEMLLKIYRSVYMK